MGQRFILSSTLPWALPALLCLGFSAVGQGAQYRQLPSQVPNVVRTLKPLERYAPTNRLELAIGLPLRNRDALTNLLRGLYNPGSARYRRFLTSSEFAEQFGPAEKDYQALIHFAQNNGLAVAARHSNRVLLDVSGSVADIERAFHVTLRVYQHPQEPRTFFAPDTDPSVDLDVPILGISGLDDFVLPRPMLKEVGVVEGWSDGLYTGSGPRGNFIGQDFRNAYAPGVSLRGSGQVVALLEFDGFYASDVRSYAQLAGLPDVPIETVLLDGTSGIPGRQNIEVALDIDMAISMAPGLAGVVVYEGRLGNDILNEMATDNVASQLSSSWGFGAAVDPVRDQIFQQFAAQGQSFFQASGDYGAWVGPIYPPSDNPLVTVVGGTTLATTGSGSWSNETAWPYSGGGVSTLYTIPSWQQDVVTAANQASLTMRNIPDVACVADGIWLVANNGEQGVIGGTSASAPLWAGFAALANEYAADSGAPPIGFINPALYIIGRSPAYAAACHDITSGNNTNNNSPSRFFAVPGYDLCTGWGTPAGSNLITALVSPPLPLRIEPNSGAVFSGPVGGPFVPTTQTYVLTNDTSSAVEWAVANSSPWLSVSPAAGVVNPGGPAATVSVGLGLLANTLLPGTYTDVLWFTNLQQNTVEPRSVTLDVVLPPAISSQPTNQAVLEGMSATFVVGISNPASVTYQWRLDNGSGPVNLQDGLLVSGATTASLTLSNISAANVGAYSVMLSNAAGSVVSADASLSIVPSAPVLLVQPGSLAVLEGQDIKFSVTAAGSQPIRYSWQRDGTNLSDGANIFGSATACLQLLNVSQADGGLYSVVLSNSLGATSSMSALLSVTGVSTPEVTMTRLSSFADGHPSGLLAASNGWFYGTTQNGGLDRAGTVFQWQPGSVPTDFYAFTGVQGPAEPRAALVRTADGSLYGTSFQGGLTGNGTVFRLTSAASLNLLVSFDNTNGAFPYASLTPGPAGQFYGVTWQGGAYHRGTVFSVSSNGIHTVLYSFSNGADGGHPQGGLSFGNDGWLYGTTYKGGVYGYGTVFKISPAGSFSSLASFAQTNGAFPCAGLTPASDGNFYGVTSQGGTQNSGVVFRVSPDGALTALYSFTGAGDGSSPTAALLQASDGNLYGTTVFGGAYSDGTIFRISPQGALSTLVSFDGFNGANQQSALVEVGDGSIYGAAYNGGINGLGTLFRFSINSAPYITAQPASQSVYEGADVTLQVAVAGSFPFSYQWARNGTNLSDGGTIFGAADRVLTLQNVTLADSGTYSVLISNALGVLTSSNALVQVLTSGPLLLSQPTNQTLAPGATARFAVVTAGNLPLVYQWRKDGTALTDGGNLSGALTSTLTLSNVTELDKGTYTVQVTNELGSVTSLPAVLDVIPPSAPGTRFATLHSFGGGDDGGNPNQLLQLTNGYIYGTTKYGGAYDAGTIFNIDGAGLFTPLFAFGPTSGALPVGGLAPGTNGDLFGTTQLGGSAGLGTLFRITLDGNLTVLHSFSGPEGANPSATLIAASDGTFFGPAKNGGASGYGTVFRASPDGSVSALYSFTNGIDGSYPSAPLVGAQNGTLYGVTGSGGGYAKGNVFQLTPGGALSVLYSFTGAQDGYAPVGPLAQGDDGNFYGATMHNVFMGFQFYGTLFRLSPTGGLVTLYTLNGFTADGFYPYAGLLASSDGNFYGTTHEGGAYGYGTLFRLSPSGGFTTLLSFDGFAIGANPEAVLVQGLDGRLYGTTTTGGPNGEGTLFRLSFNGAPQVTSAPAAQKPLLGSNVRLSAAVFGAPPLSFRWQKDGVDLSDGGNVSGAATRILNFTNITLADSGNYALLISNALGSVTTSAATLKVLAAPAFQAVYLTNGIIALTWSTMPGERYQLQYVPTVNTASWINLGPVATATTNTLSAFDTLGTNNQRLYRVYLLR